MSVFVYLFLFSKIFMSKYNIYIYTKIYNIYLYYNKIIIIKLYAYHINKKYAHECFLFVYFYLDKFSCQNTIFIFILQ